MIILEIAALPLVDLVVAVDYVVAAAPRLVADVVKSPVILELALVVRDQTSFEPEVRPAVFLLEECEFEIDNDLGFDLDSFC